MMRHGCESFGENSVVLGSAKFENIHNISIGSGCVINEGVYIGARDKVQIGNGVHISSYCIINTGSLTPGDMSKVHTTKPVVIEDDAWLASGVIVCPGVTIGKGSVVGAGAVVLQDVPSFSLAVGVPARVVKELSQTPL